MQPATLPSLPPPPAALSLDAALHLVTCGHWKCFLLFFFSSVSSLRRVSSLLCRVPPLPARKSVESSPRCCSSRVSAHRRAPERVEIPPQTSLRVSWPRSPCWRKLRFAFKSWYKTKQDVLIIKRAVSEGQTQAVSSVSKTFK